MMKLNDSRIFAFIVVIFENISYFYGGLLGTVFSSLLIFYCMAGLLINRAVFFERIALLCMLMIGEWTYVSSEQASTVYSLRMGGISIISILLLFSILTIGRTKKYYIAFFLFYSIISILYLFFDGLSYFNLFTRDLRFYLLIAIALMLITEFFQKETLTIAIRAGVLQVLLAFLMQNKFDYGGGHYYLIQSSIVYIFLPIVLIGAIKHKYEVFLYMVFFIGLYVYGQLFAGGKSFLFAMLALGYILIRKPIFGVPVVAISISVFYVYLGIADPIALYKIQQVLLIMDLQTAISTHTSVGNILGEAYTLVRSWEGDIFGSLFGKGVGGGLSDSFLLFQPWVGVGGYDILQYEKDHYIRLHLSILNYILKYGFLIFLVATIWIYKLVPRENLLKLTLLAYPLFLLISDANLATFFVCVFALRYLMEKYHESI